MLRWGEQRTTRTQQTLQNKLQVASNRVSKNPIIVFEPLVDVLIVVKRVTVHDQLEAFQQPATRHTGFDGRRLPC